MLALATSGMTFDLQLFSDLFKNSAGTSAGPDGTGTHSPFRQAVHVAGLYDYMMFLGE